MQAYAINKTLGYKILADILNRNLKDEYKDTFSVLGSVMLDGGYYEYHAQNSDPYNNAAGRWSLVDLVFFTNDPEFPAVVAPKNELLDIEKYINAEAV